MTQTTALATTDINLDDLQRTARMLAASGYFDAKGSPEVQIAQLATKILAGRELGYGPFASVQGIHVIQGKPQVSANLMAAAVKSHPRYDYRVRKMDADLVEIEFFENGQSIGKSAFTRDDATKAGTQNMGKFPRNMLFARALSNGVRWFCPDVFNGQSVYVEGEIEETGDDTPAVVVVDRETGEVVEGECTESVAPAKSDGGNGHKPAPAAEDVPMISKVQLKALHAVGTDLYGKEWDAKRPHLVEHVTKGSATSANDLTAKEAEKLIEGMRDRIAKRNHDAEHSDEQPVDNPFVGEAVPA